MKNFYLNPFTVFNHPFNGKKTAALSKMATVLIFFLFSYKISVAQFPAMAKLSIHLLLNTNGGSANTADGCMMLYNDNFTTGLGPEDSYKFINLDENIAIVHGNKLLSVEGKPLIVNNDSVSLKIWQYRHPDYYLQLTGSDFASSLTAVLKDNYLHQNYEINLAGVTTVHFTLTGDTASADPNRFSVVFLPASAPALSMVSCSGVQKDRNVLLEWTMTHETAGVHYEIEKATNEVSFSKIATVNIDAAPGTQTHRWIDYKALPGTCFYNLKTISNTGQVLFSKMIKVTVAELKQSIAIYPNPVQGGTMGLQLFNLDKGTYHITLTNSFGQPVLNTTLLHAGGTATRQIAIGNYLVKGAYSLSFTNGKTTYNKAVIIN